jgi:hypothetical protein
VVTDAWACPRRIERNCLWQHWQRECQRTVSRETAQLLQSYSQAQAALHTEYDRTTLAALRSARVVGMTTSQVAKMQRVVAALHPKVSSTLGLLLAS